MPRWQPLAAIFWPVPQDPCSWGAGEAGTHLKMLLQRWPLQSSIKRRPSIRHVSAVLQLSRVE
jgi:hypothetical protein